MVDPIVTTTIANEVLKDPKATGELIEKTGNAGKKVINSAGTSGALVIDSAGKAGSGIIETTGNSVATVVVANGQSTATKTTARGEADATVIQARANFLDSFANLPVEIQMQIVERGMLEQMLATKPQSPTIGTLSGVVPPSLAVSDAVAQSALATTNLLQGSDTRKRWQEAVAQEQNESSPSLQK